MIWGFMASNGKFKIYRVDGTMTSAKYIELLEKILNVIIDMDFKLGGVTFMQGNASFHNQKIL